MSVLIIACALLVGAFLAFSTRLRASTRWRAMLAPLASIMGSGFLVSGPLLGGLVGHWAVLCMALLLLLAFGVGSAIRFNIRYFEPIEDDGHGPAQSIAFLSRLVLAGAYFISISYYLQLLAAFVLRSSGLEAPAFVANLVTTTLLVVIGGIGMWRGLAVLGKVEKYAVAFNLGMIAALLVGLLVYNGLLVSRGTWSLPEMSAVIDFADVRVLLGLLIVVQGFETSRYLGDEFSRDERIVSMRWAQGVSSVIYLTFIGLITVFFHEGLNADVTAIIQMVGPVAVVLPVLIAVAAVGSQFSAAVADTEGAGGLVREITHKRVSTSHAYGLILLITVALTWGTDVNGIIAYASRAFALFYMLQCLVAVIVARGIKDLERRNRRMALFGLLALLCLLVFALGVPAE